MNDEKPRKIATEHGKYESPDEDAFLPEVVGGEGGGGFSSGGMPSTTSGAIRGRVVDSEEGVDDSIGYEAGQEGAQSRREKSKSR